MKEKKKLAINMFGQVLNLGINFCISFFLTPYIISQVGAEAYGFVGLANEFIGYAQIITVAINSMASRFIILKFHEKDYQGANKFFNSVLIANTILGFVLGICGFFIVLFIDKLVNISPNILFDVRLLWILMFLNFITSIITSVFGIATFAKNRLYLSSFRQIQAQILRSLVLIICFAFLPASTWYIGLGILIYTTVVAIYNYKYIKELTPEIEFNHKYFDFKSLLEVLKSGIWNTITKISGLLSSGLDLLITNKVVGATAMGILSISKTIPNVILAAFGTISSVFAPELTYSYAQKKYDDMKEQLICSIKILAFFSCIPMSILFAYGSEFYALWAPSQDNMLLHTLSIITCFAFVFSLPLEPLWNIFTITNKVKQSSLFLITTSFLSFLIVMISINFVTDKTIMLYIIAGVSTVFSLIKSFTFLPLYGAKCLKFKLTTFYPIIFKNFVCISIITILSVLIKNFIAIDGWITLIVCAGLTCLLSCLINFYTLFNKEDRIDVINGIKKKLKKVN